MMYFLIDNTILQVAMNELERVDSLTAEQFLAKTPRALLVELMPLGKNEVVAFPSRLFMEFLFDCEQLGLIN